MEKLTSRNIGIILGLLMVTVSLIMFYGLKWPVTGQNQFAVLLIFTIGIIASLFIFKARQPGDHTFKEYFSEGFKTFIIVAFIMVVYTFVFYKMNPQILEDTIKENNALIVKEGDHTPAEISANADKLRSIFMPMMLTINTIKYLLLGAIISAVGAGFLSQKRS